MDGRSEEMCIGFQPGQQQGNIYPTTIQAINTTVIQIFAPIATAEDSEIEEFYTLLSCCMQGGCIPGDRRTKLLGIKLTT